MNPNADNASSAKSEISQSSNDIYQSKVQDELSLFKNMTDIAPADDCV